MSSVDERVVRMQFDNSGFEAGATKAIAILDKLNSSLKLDGAVSGLENAKNSLSSFNLSSISNGIRDCISNFGFLGSKALEVFDTIRFRAVSLGKDLVEKLTVKPMIDGFGEYETQMRSVQTILSNTRDKLNEAGITDESQQIGLINSKLDELNEYADKTIYNFSEMTRNIGTFTAAGVDLDTATSSIQGIANLAAASGSSSQQASTAMYQLSQAISTGTLKLQDWNSVVNAGMGGELFQNALKRTARNHGVAVDQMIEKNGSFRESLQEGWITSDILTETLEQLTYSYDKVGDASYEAGMKKLLDAGYSKEDAEAILDLAKNAQEAATKVRTWTQLWDTVGEALGSGWATTWRTVVGDFLEATDLFTHLSDRITDLIGRSADARNAVLADWSSKGGRGDLVAGIKYIVDAIYSIIETFGRAFSDVFGITSEQLLNVTAAFGEFASKLVPSQAAVDGLYSVLYDLFTIIHSVIGVVGNVARIIGSLIGLIWQLTAPLRWLLGLAFGAIAKGFAVISSAILSFTDILESGIGTVTGFVSGVVGKIFDVFVKTGSAIKNAISGIAQAFSEFFGTFNIFSSIGGKIAELFDALFGKNSALSQSDSAKPTGFMKIIEFMESIQAKSEGMYQKAKDFLEGSKFFAKAREILSSVGAWGSNYFDQAIEFIKGSNVLSKVSDKLSSFSDSVSNFVRNAISKVSEFIRFLKTTKPDELIRIIGDHLQSIYDDLEEVSPTLASIFKKVTKTLLGPIASLMIGADSYEEVFDRIKTAATEAFNSLPDTVKSLFERVVGAFSYAKENLTGEASELSFENVVTNFTNLKDSLGSLVQGIVDGVISIPDLLNNAWNTVKTTFENFFGNLPTFDDVLSFAGPVLKGGFAVALIGMVKSIKDLAKTIGGVGKGIIDWPKNFGSALSKFGEGFNKWREETKADAVLKIATSLLILAGALFVIASIPADDLARAGSALAKMAIGVAAFLVIFSLLDKFKVTNAATLTAIGAALQGLGIGMLALAGAAFILSMIPDDQLKKGADAVLELIAALSLYIAAVGKNGGSLLSGSIGLIFLAGALYLLTYAIEKFGEADPEQMQQGLEAFERVMASLALFGKFGAEGIAKLFASVAQLGIGILLISASFGVLAVSMLALSVALKMIDNLWAVVGVMAVSLIAFVAAAKLLKDTDPVGVGAGLLIMASAFVVLAAALFMLSIVDTKKLIASAAVLGVLSIVFAAIARFVDPDALKAAGEAFIGIGLAVLIMSVGLGVLASLDADSIIRAGVVIGTLSGMFAVIAYAVDPEKLSAAGTAFLMLGASILIMSAGFKVFESIDSGKMWQSFAIIALIMAGFAAIAYMVNPVSLIALGKSLAIFSVGILVLAAAFKVFESVNPDSIVPTLIAIGGAAAIFVAACWLLTPIAEIVVGVSVALLAFSASVLVLASAFWIAADAIKVLNDIGPEGVVATMLAFGTGLGLIIDQLAARAPELGKALVNLAIAVFQALVAALGPILQNVWSWLQQHFPEFIEWGKSVLDKIFEALGKAGEWLSENFPGFMAAIGDFLGQVASVMGPLISNLWEGIKTLVGTIIANAGPFIHDMIEKIKAFLVEKWPVILETILNWKDSIFTSISAWKDKLVEAGGNVVEGLKQGISDKVSSLAETAQQVFDNFVNSVKSFFGIASPSTVMQEVGDNVIQGLINGIDGLLGNLGGKALEVGGAILNGIGDLAGGLKDKAVSGMTAFADGVGSFVGSVTSKGSEIAGGIVNGAKGLGGKMKGQAADGMTGFVDGIASKQGAVKSAASKISSIVVDSFKNLASRLKTTVSGSMDGVVSALHSCAARVKPAASVIRDSIIRSFDGIYERTRQIGEDIGNGLIRGMNNKLVAVRKKAEELGAAAVKGTNRVPQTSSPSKATTKIGQYIGDGLILGMSKRMTQVENSGTKLGKQAVDSCSSAMSRLSIGMDDLLETDYTPVISPVINPTQFNSDLSSLNRAMNTNMNRIVLDGMNYNTELNAKMVDYADSNNKALQAIADGVIDYNLLGTAVAAALINSGLHVEMDGGQLMGYLAGEIRDVRRMYG